MGGGGGGERERKREGGKRVNVCPCSYRLLPT